MEPNGLEGSIIASLKEVGIYASDRGTAQLGQIYYTDTKENPWWICLADGRKKRPDFKVKGQRKVIELYGNYWHSEEHCKPKGLPEYHWNAARMIDEYAKVGYQAVVYWETELRDPVRRAEIIQEIVAFASDDEDD
jgi:hypothetical protein